MISKTASGGTRRYYAQDGLGTTVALSNTSGASVGTAQYYAYGEQRTATGESAAPFKFAGEQRDASTGLYYLRARYYDPDAGRFITKDPWGGSTMAPGTLNGYPYVLGNPANLVDPSGLCPSVLCVDWFPWAPDDPQEGWSLYQEIRSTGCDPAVMGVAGVYGRVARSAFTYGANGIQTNPLNWLDALKLTLGLGGGGYSLAHDLQRARGEHPARYEGQTSVEDPIGAVLDVVTLGTAPGVFFPGAGQAISGSTAFLNGAYRVYRCYQNVTKGYTGPNGAW